MDLPDELVHNIPNKDWDSVKTQLNSLLSRPAYIALGFFVI